MRVTSQDILHGPIGNTLYRMTVPMVIGIFCMMAFSAVDIFFVSMMGSQELAAISFTLPVTMMLFNLIIGLSVATSVMVGSAIGRGDHDQAARLTTDSLMFTVVLTLAVSTAGFFTIDPLFRLLGASELTLPLIHEYMDIYYICFGLMVIPMVGNSAIRATGDTKWPSILMIAGGLINVILDPILIFGFGPIPAMGVAGAAWATAGSWVIGFFAGFYLLYAREKLITFSMPPFDVIYRHWQKMLKTGVPISVANMMTPAAAAALTAFVAQSGEIAVAGLGAGNRIEVFSLVIPFAITAALSPFMAQNLGAGNLERAHESLVLCVKFILKFQFGVFVIFVGGARWLAQVFSTDPEIVKVARIYLWIMPLGLGFYGIIVVLNTAFNAQHRSERTLILSLIRILLLYIPLAWLGGHLFGIPGIFAGATIGNGIAALGGWYYYIHTRPQPST